MFSGIRSDGQNTSSTWPSDLPTGWTMEWEPSTSYGSNELCHVRACHDIYPTTVVYSHVLLSAAGPLLYSLFL